jgi:hypothetical protein
VQAEAGSPGSRRRVVRFAEEVVELGPESAELSTSLGSNGGSGTSNIGVLKHAAVQPAPAAAGLSTLARQGSDGGATGGGSPKDGAAASTSGGSGGSDHSNHHRHHHHHRGLLGTLLKDAAHKASAGLEQIKSISGGRGGCQRSWPRSHEAAGHSSSPSLRSGADATAA